MAAEPHAPARLLPPELEPKLLTTLREGYSARDFGRDALAGVVVGVVALPLAIAFAIASGVRPEQGLYTAIVGGLPDLGVRRQPRADRRPDRRVRRDRGRRGRAVRPGRARRGDADRRRAAVGMAFARLGDVIRFVPYPVTVGFTTGIALIIATGQIGDALGLSIEKLPPDFCHRVLAYYAAARRRPARGRGDLCSRRSRSSSSGRASPRACRGRSWRCVATTALVHVARAGRSRRSRDRFGAVPSSLPSFRLPAIDWQQVPELFSPAVSIALLAAIESLLSAVVADGQIGGRHRSNAELLGQGIANIASPLFGGIPATGAIARTATNVRTGGRTPVAGMVHALVLLVILVAAGPWAGWIPMATLAGHPARRRLQHERVARVRAPAARAAQRRARAARDVRAHGGREPHRGDPGRRGARVAPVHAAHGRGDPGEGGARRARLRDLPSRTSASRSAIPPGVGVFEINGSFCFGAARKFTEALLASHRPTRVVVLRMRHVLAIDATGLQALEDVAARLRKRGTRLLIAGVHAQPLVALERSGALERIGAENLFETFEEALDGARARWRSARRRRPRAGTSRARRCSRAGRGSRRASRRRIPTPVSIARSETCVPPRGAPALDLRAPTSRAAPRSRPRPRCRTPRSRARARRAARAGSRAGRSCATARCRTGSRRPCARRAAARPA